MSAMLRKSGLSQLKKFKEFISKQGGDISKKLKDKTVTNTLDKHIDVSDNEPNTNMKTDRHLKNLSKKSIINKSNENNKDRYLSDEEIEAGYENYAITDFKVNNLFDDGGASGYIEILFDPDDDENSHYKFDNWIKYDSGPRIAFDNWYPSRMNNELKEYIEKGIKEEKLKQDAKKYNM